MSGRTTDATVVAEYGPWRVTTRTIRTVERVKQRPKDGTIQPVYRFKDGQPFPAPAAMEGGPLTETVTNGGCVFQERRAFAVRHVSLLTGIDEWRLWAGWLAVHADTVDNLPPLRPLSKPRAGRRKGAAHG